MASILSRPQCVNCWEENIVFMELTLLSQNTPVCIWPKYHENSFQEMGWLSWWQFCSWLSAFKNCKINQTEGSVFELMENLRENGGQCMYWSGELFRHWRGSYFGVYSWSCEATREINTKITLEWMHKPQYNHMTWQLWRTHMKSDI